ncbi:flavocytochrome c [Christensenellaceae bacterium OttesenSCG-928-M15]|nr:flavocytochrome c [Christensenellaceae bacterium OttesenSCG-928-M15]
MKKSKTLIALLLAAMLMGLAACSTPASEPAATPAPASASPISTPEAEALYIPGEYTGEGMGNNGPIAVKVTLSETAIVTVEITSEGETESIATGALESIPLAIVAGQTLAVDTISGATHTSEGILAAVEQALSSAGADVALLKTPADGGAKETSTIEKTADIIIVGGGGAGLAAAVEATANGASVIMIEKTSILGGNTLVCGGIYNCPDPQLQEPAGIEDSVELFIKQTYEGGDMVGDLTLITTLCENAYDGLTWLKELGVEFQDVITQGPGSLYPRTHDTVNGTGADIIKAYEDTLCARTDLCEIMMTVTGDSLLTDGGRVTGVSATDQAGNTLLLHANDFVILATGGFAGNVDMRVQYCQGEKWPYLGENLLTSNMAGITGDGIRMAQAVGANLVDMEQIQLLHMCNINNGSTAGNTIKCKSVDSIIFVNKEGNRFVCEDGRRDEISKGALEQTGGIMYAIESADGNPGNYDQMQTNDGRSYTKAIADGDLISADTVEELAALIGADASNLQAALDEYNANVEKGAKEDQFGRTTFINKIETGPFIATPRCPAAHHTMGGVQIDTSCHVLRPDGTIIEGLLAAGEITGDIHGGNRLGGNAVVDTVVFGRIAGQTATK